MKLEELKQQHADKTFIQASSLPGNTVVTDDLEAMMQLGSVFFYVEYIPTIEDLIDDPVYDVIPDEVKIELQSVLDAETDIAFTLYNTQYNVKYVYTTPNSDNIQKLFDDIKDTYKKSIFEKRDKDIMDTIVSYADRWKKAKTVKDHDAILREVAATLNLQFGVDSRAESKYTKEMLRMYLDGAAAEIEDEPEPVKGSGKRTIA